MTKWIIGKKKMTLKNSKKEIGKKLVSKIPKNGTRAFEGFYKSWGQIQRFFNFILASVGSIDKTAEIAHNVLVETEKDESKKEKMIQKWSKRISAVAALKSHRQFFIEIIFVRHVENFLNYFSSLLYEIFIHRPETLKSSEKIDVASVLRHDSIESVIRDLAERKIEALSYSSFSDLAKFFHERFGLSLASVEEISNISEAIEIRNISVHNQCTINKRFVNRLRMPNDQIGKKRDLYLRDLEHLVPILPGMVERLDLAASTKFHLARVRFAKQDA